MITPEFIVTETGEFIFVANHNLQTEEGLCRSFAFNRARILLARAHIPRNLSHCVVTYDLRGQRLPVDIQARICAEFGDLCEVRFLT